MTSITEIHVQYLGYIFLFGILWQFLRWCVLTKWLITTIEKLIIYLLKNGLQYTVVFCAYIWKRCSHNGIRIIQEIWQYRIGKISLVSGGIYLCYIAYTTIFSS